MKKFQITVGIIAAVCVILVAVFTPIQYSLAHRLDSELVCERWSGDGTRYAQLSAFISPLAGYSETDAEYSLTSSLDSALVEASIEPANEDARLYAYAYSGEARVSLSRLDPETGATKKSGVQAVATGVGADFFLFHRLKLLSGYYFDPSEKIPGDLIVIDNDLAWQFFGSPDIAGQELLVNGRRCYITGVVEREPEYNEFYGETPRIYMSYSLLSELSGDLNVTTLELCAPDPISGFAADILERSLGADEKLVEIVENSARFTDKGLAKRLSDFSERSVRTKLVSYPYWENSAVKLVDKAALLYLGKLVPIVILVLLAVAEIVVGYVNRRKFYAFVGSKVGGAWDRYQHSRYLRREAKRQAKEKSNEAN